MTRDRSSVRDVMVLRGDQAMFPCVVNYQLPQEEIAYSWKFAEGVSRGGAGGGKAWPRQVMAPAGRPVWIQDS